MTVNGFPCNMVVFYHFNPVIHWIMFVVCSMYFLHVFVMWDIHVIYYRNGMCVLCMIKVMMT